MRPIVASIESEYRRYKTLADAAMAQLSEAELGQSVSSDGNSVIVIAWHLGGDFASRFTEFLTTDGEKPWRKRDEEFAARNPTREELSDHWERGWSILFGTLGELNDEQLERIVTIRGVELRVHEALHRSLAHAGYHVGQIVFLARALRGPEWRFLSVPPGGSEAYNRNPTAEHADSHAAKLRERGGLTRPDSKS